MSEKSVLVFLHYFGGAAQSWKWVADLLPANYHCICIDMPGFGAQPPLAEPSIEAIAKQVQEQLAALQIKNFTLIGHSMGGKIALQIAANLQQEAALRQLILLAPSPPSIERMPERDQQRMLKHPNLQEAKTTVKNSSLITLSAEKFETGVHTQMIADDTTWRWWIEQGIHHSIAALAATITIPITLIASKDDPAVTYQMTLQDSMPNLPPQTKLISTEGIGHLFPLEDPEWLAQCLTQIL